MYQNRRRWWRKHCRVTAPSTEKCCDSSDSAFLRQAPACMEEVEEEVKHWFDGAGEWNGRTATLLASLPSFRLPLAEGP